jgi:uncharacterized protein YpmB
MKLSRGEHWGPASTLAREQGTLLYSVNNNNNNDKNIFMQYSLIDGV